MSRYSDPLPFDAPDWSSKDNLTVGRVPTAVGADFIARHHYARGCGINVICFGLYRGARLEGVAAFANSASQDAAASVFGPEHTAHVRDLQRFVLVDEAPKNSESWFLVRALRMFKKHKPDLWAVTSYADTGYGHRGTIYQATNAIYSGTGTGGGASWRFVDASGRMRSERQNGRTITRAEAIERGWSIHRATPKHRYVFLTPDGRSHRRQLISLLRWTSEPYPKDPASALRRTA